MLRPRPEPSRAVEEFAARPVAVAGAMDVDVAQQQTAVVLEVEAADQAVAAPRLDDDRDPVQLAAVVVERAHYEVAAGTAQNFWKAPARSSATSCADRPSMRWRGTK